MNGVNKINKILDVKSIGVINILQKNVLDVNSLFDLFIFLFKIVFYFFFFYYIWWFRKDRFKDTLHYYSISETEIRRKKEKEDMDRRIKNAKLNKKIYLKPQTKKDIFYNHINIRKK